MKLQKYRKLVLLHKIIIKCYCRFHFIKTVTRMQGQSCVFSTVAKLLPCDVCVSNVIICRNVAHFVILRKFSYLEISSLFFKTSIVKIGSVSYHYFLAYFFLKKVSNVTLSLSLMKHFFAAQVLKGS